MIEPLAVIRERRSSDPDHPGPEVTVSRHGGLWKQPLLPQPDAPRPNCRMRSKVCKQLSAHIPLARIARSALAGAGDRRSPLLTCMPLLFGSDKGTCALRSRRSASMCPSSSCRAGYAPCNYRRPLPKVPEPLRPVAGCTSRPSDPALVLARKPELRNPLKGASCNASLHPHFGS